MLEYDSIITNGYVDRDTIAAFITKGWTFVVTLPAKMVHPHALATDKWTLFSKYIPYERREGDSNDAACSPETGVNS
mgnify:CR=1 FL=1